DLAEWREVAGHTVLAEPALVAHAEASHDFVDDQQRAVGVRELLELRVEAGAVRSDGGTSAHVARGGLSDDGGDLTFVLGKSLLDGLDVAVRDHNGVAGCSLGDARGVRQPEGGHTGAGSNEQGVNVAVVAAFELQDLVAAGEATG